MTRKLFLILILVNTSVFSSPYNSGAQIAASVGLPGIDASNQIAGPFIGQQNTIYYLGNAGLITYFHPTQYFAYFGELQGDIVKYKYMLTPQGQYVINDYNQSQQVNVLPNDVYRWPHANAVAQVLVQYLMAIKQGMIAAPSQSTDWNTMSQISSDMHKSTMSILGRMGDDGCTQYYDGVYYLGCW